MFNRMYWKAYCLWLALQWAFQINLGDKVWYKGKKYLVANGVIANQWRLSDLDNSNEGWVQRSDCKKILLFGNYLRSVKSGYRFYKTSWLDIWCREGIKPWMRGCNIWPRWRSNNDR